MVKSLVDNLLHNHIKSPHGVNLPLIFIYCHTKNQTKTANMKFVTNNVGLALSCVQKSQY